MKIDRRQTPAVSRTERAPSSPAPAPAPAARAQQKAHVDPGHAGTRLKGERANEWGALAAASQKNVFGASGVQGLADRYGVDSVPQPLEKFFKSLAFIDEQVSSSKDPKQAATALLSHDSRREVFRLEALLRLYGHDLGHKREGLEPLVKELEDHIGAVASYEHALQVAVDHHAPQAVTDRIGALAQSSREAVVQLLAEKWMPGADGHSRPVAQLVKGLASYDFGSPKDDRKNLKHLLANQAEALRKSDLPMNELETGVHKLRRQLRWLSLSMESAGGLVQATPSGKPNEHFEKLRAAADPARIKEIAADSLPPLGEGDHPIEVPRELYFGLQRAIFEFGAIKDDCEAYQLISSAMKDTGASASEIAKVVGTRGSAEDMEARATVLRDELKDHHLLKGLEHAFED